MSYKQQHAEFAKLEEAGYISTMSKGMPKIKYFKVNEDALFNKFAELPKGQLKNCQKVNSRTAKRSTHEQTKGQINNNKLIKLNNNIKREIELSSECF